MAAEQNLLDKTIALARNLIENSAQEGTWFNYKTYSGTYYVSQYYLLGKWLGELHFDFDIEIYKEILYSSQLPDGSWYQVKDANLEHGELNTTFINYWALKAMGENPESPAMEKACSFILSQGGMEKVNLFTKTLLSLFGELSWDEIPAIPYVLFIENSLIDHRCFAQWIGPHILPFSYLKRLEVKKNLGPIYSVQELSLQKKKVKDKNKRLLPFIDSFIVQKIIKEQSSSGALGGYTHSTLFALAVLDHFSKESSSLSSGIMHFRIQAEEYLWKMYLDPEGAPYAGSTCDGHYWDSVFCAQALIESGGNQMIIRNVAAYVAKVQTPEGGVPFGIGFEKAPDVDDTVEAMLVWSSLKEFSKEMNLAKEWLLNRQNKDGGWGAFGHNNNEMMILKLHSKKFLDTAELFDYSSPDCTGNILEALSHVGLNENNSDIVKRGVAYLMKEQHPGGPWFGRWAINYIFGTYVSLMGLLAAGRSPEEPALKKAIDWLISCQNPDGGFGESTLSYMDETRMGKGVSTNSQTAWALLALMEAGYSGTSTVENGINYLLKFFSENNKFEDISVIGTGHPRNVYLQYPSYAACFPLMALCRYRKSLNG